MKISKNKSKYHRELTSSLYDFDNSFCENNNLSYIGGVDEAGRGALAGPVVASFVVLDLKFPILGLNDSKKLLPKRREYLFERITDNALSISVGIVDHKTIDSINILNATKEAMYFAIDKCSFEVSSILIDALVLPNLNVRSSSIIRGDSKSASIAAASIIAKVTRDRIMTRYDDIYPNYSFSAHKGYPTKAHLERLKQYGISPIHRKTYKPVIPFI